MTFFHKWLSSELPDTGQASGKHQIFMRAPPPQPHRASLVSPQVLAGRVGTGALPSEKDYTHLLLHAPQTLPPKVYSPLSLLCHECVKNNHDNHLLHRETAMQFTKQSSLPRALYILPETGPRAPSRHQLTP